MAFVRAAAAFVAGSLLASSAAHAADRAVHLVVPPPVRPNVAAMPLIADPADDAERRINTALRRLDATVRKAAADCKGDDGKPGDWERTVDVPMRGPGYISFVITDSQFCGGAHPDSGTMSIVYDLRTGAPVDWTHLLPPTLTGTVALEAQMDDTKMVTLASKRLYSLYLAGYHQDGTAEDQAECKQALQDNAGDGTPAIMPWLDAKIGGLALLVGLPHAEQPCEMPVVIAVATLRSEGAQPALLEALQAAHPK